MAPDPVPAAESVRGVWSDWDKIERLEAAIYDLTTALVWAVRDGRAHGVSVCTCARCEKARATLASYEEDA